MTCSKCTGRTVTESVVDTAESFTKIEVLRCLNCGFVSYPNFTPEPAPVYIKGGRKGIPMLFRQSLMKE